MSNVHKVKFLCSHELTKVKYSLTTVYPLNYFRLLILRHPVHKFSKRYRLHFLIPDIHVKSRNVQFNLFRLFIFKIVPNPCSNPLGMKDETIEDHQITVSSLFSETAIYARLDHDYAWIPDADDSWIQVNLTVMRNVSGIVTQGHSELYSWVITYKVEHSVDGANWTYVKEDGQIEAKVRWT